MNALLGALLAQAPALNPQDPPGWDKVETIINWAAKLTIAACFAGFLITAATMAVQHRRGTLGPEAMGQFGTSDQPRRQQARERARRAIQARRQRRHQ